MWFKKLSKEKNTITTKDFKKRTSKILHASLMINALERTRIIIEKDGYYIKKPILNKWIHSHSPIEDRSILFAIKRIKGATVVSIAKENSLSVNQTRDLIKQGRAKISPLYEDFFFDTTKH